MSLFSKSEYVKEKKRDIIKTVFGKYAIFLKPFLKIFEGKKKDEKKIKLLVIKNHIHQYLCKYFLKKVNLGYSKQQMKGISLYKWSIKVTVCILLLKYHI